MQHHSHFQSPTTLSHYHSHHHTTPHSQSHLHHHTHFAHSLPQLPHPHTQIDLRVCFTSTYLEVGLSEFCMNSGVLTWAEICHRD
jgi:hypothetical protein